MHKVLIQKLVAMGCCLATTSERQDQGESSASIAEEDRGRLGRHYLSVSAQDLIMDSSQQPQNKLPQFPLLVQHTLT